MPYPITETFVQFRTTQFSNFKEPALEMPDA